MLDQLEALDAKFQEVEAQLQDPAVVSDAKKLRELTKLRAELEPVVEAWAKQRTRLKQLEEAEGILADKTMDADLREMAEMEIPDLKVAIAEGESELCQAPNHPLKPELGKRDMPFARELWIEREDFMEEPVKGFHRLYPGNMVRLRYGFVVKCTGCEKDAAGTVTTVFAEYMPDSRSGTPGADTYKVKGNLHWVSVAHAYEAEVRIYDRLFAHPHPGQRREGDAPELERDFLTDINPDSRRSLIAYLEPILKDARPEEHFQFERHGYFVADRIDSKPGSPAFNRTVTLKDSWAKASK